MVEAMVVSDYCPGREASAFLPGATASGIASIKDNANYIEPDWL